MKLNDSEFDYLTHYKIDAEEFDYFEERIGPAKHEEQRVHETIILKVPRNAKYILDVGCGSGWIAQKFLSPDRKVFSLDVSKTNPLRIHNSLNDNINHFPIVADAFQLPFRDNTLDCVIASEIIEHTYNPKEFIRELFRVVAKGGRLIISTPYKEKLRYHLCIHCNRKTPENAHLHSFDEEVLKELYNKDDLKKFNYIVFGNKALIFLRTHIILKYFPYSIWYAIDWLANKIYEKPLHIVCVYEKSN